MLRNLSIVFIFSFASIILLSFSIPLQTDEIFYKLINTRLFTDDSQLITLFPQCKESFHVKPPLLWLFPRGLEWLIYHNIENIFYIRVLGILSYLGFLALILWIAKSLLAIKDTYALLAIIALLSLDTLPFLMVVNRPEQNIIISVAALVALTLWVLEKTVLNRWLLPGITIGFLLLVNYLFSMHPKAILFLPLAAAAGFYIGRAFKNTFLIVFYSVTSIVFAFISLKTYLARAVCDDVPSIKVMVGDFYLTPKLLFAAPLQFIRTGFHNIVMSFNYFTNILTIPRASSDWLPAYIGDVPKPYQLFDTILSYFLSLFYLTLTLYVILQLFKKLKIAILQKNIAPKTTLAFILAFSLFGIAFFQNIKMFYETTLFIPLILLIGILLLPSPPFNGAKFRQFICWLLVIAIFSHANMIFKYYDYAFPNALQENNILEKNANSRLILSTPHNFEKTKNAVVGAAKQCHIPLDASGNHIVTDMLTYSFFRNTKEPFSIDYVTGIWRGVEFEDTSDFLQLLKENDSSGIVTLCAATPRALRQEMGQSGDFCCMSKEKIQSAWHSHIR